MGLRELSELGLLLPREHWGHTPSASRRTAVLTTLAALLGLVSAALVWSGAGGTLTLVGLGLFLVDLGLFLLATFQAVEHRVAALEKLDRERPG
ncbi:MAG: hypothetical protein PVI57_20330 [Gemmatimonadota bacterium]|jgi:hypothetical protein